MKNNTFAMAGGALRARPCGFFGLLAYLDSFLRSRKALDRSARTLDEYRLACRGFSEFLTARYADDDVRRVTRRDIEDFLIEYQETRSSTTANKTFRALRALFNWLWREEEIEANPLARVQAPPADRAPREGYSPDEVKAMLLVRQREQRLANKGSPRRQFLATRDLALLLVLYDTGLRASEVTAMTVEGIDWQAGVFAVPGKGCNVYQRHLGDRALGAIDRCLRLRRHLHDKASGPLWVGWMGEPLTRSGLRRLCILRGQQADVRGATVHRWRYTHSESWRS
jgi:site-specific recombinase XerD